MRRWWQRAAERHPILVTIAGVLTPALAMALWMGLAAVPWGAATTWRMPWTAPTVTERCDVVAREFMAYMDARYPGGYPEKFYHGAMKECLGAALQKAGAP